MLWQTRVRATISPYLPPPVLHAILKIDPKLEPYVGPEASVTLVSTLLVAYITLKILRFLSSRLGGSGRAIADDEDEDHDVLSKSALTKSAAEYDATVLLCGPMHAGKTRLFYQLCFGQNDVATVTSIKANVGVATENDVAIRYMDWPGHASLEDEALANVWTDNKNLYVVMVLDATQPVAAAADTLLQLVALADSRQKPLPVFVACHKNDLRSAKKWQRIKIQLRTELERLVATTTLDTALVKTLKKDNLQLEDLPNVELHFASTTCCGGRVNDELVQYCQTGKLPATATS